MKTILSLLTLLLAQPALAALPIVSGPPGQRYTIAGSTLATTFASSVTVNGAGGLDVRYGISAGSVTATFVKGTRSGAAASTPAGDFGTQGVGSSILLRGGNAWGFETDGSGGLTINNVSFPYPASGFYLSQQGSMNLIGNLIFNNNPEIRRTTNDGSDNGYLQIGGGGGIGLDRGGYLNLGGNEATGVSLGGKAQLVAGNVATGTVDLLTGGNNRFSVANSGDISVFPGTSVTSTFTATTGALDLRGPLTVAGSTLTVSTNGSVTSPSQPGVGAYRSASAQSIADSTATDMIFNALNYSRGGLGWTSKSTATVAGIYYVGCGVSWAGSAVGVRQLAIVTSNVGQQAVVTEPGAAGGNSQSVSMMVSLAGSDTVSCQVTQTSGGALNINQSFNTLGVMQKVW